MTPVLVLGGSGMLGSMVVDVLSRDDALRVTATMRDPSRLEAARRRLPEVRWVPFDANDADRLDPPVREHEWIVNAIGVTKPRIDEQDARSVERAIRVNAAFPHTLTRAAVDAGATVVQIATDCVFAGTAGGYTEDHPHDCLDVYGKTKSLGEVANHVINVRSSIIGPEPKDFKFLLEWVRRQPDGARLRGFRNHRWNGVTTLHFARVCLGIIKSPALARRLRAAPVHHLAPADVVTKLTLLERLLDAYRRQDVTVDATDAPVAVDRSLLTGRPETNAAMWDAAGYPTPPAVASMVDALAAHDFRLGDLDPPADAT